MTLTTYILPSLIERYLVIELKNKVLYKWLDGLKNKKLDLDEQRIYDQFKLLPVTGQVLFVGNRQDMEERIWEIGRKYNVIPDDQHMRKIFCKDNLMIVTILDSSYVKSVLRPEYYSLLELLFRKENLNLRNNIAHGNSTTYDYLDITFVSVMMQILMDLATGDLLNE